MTIRLEEIVYLHCHQQGKARLGAAGGEAVTLTLQWLGLWGVPVWGCCDSALGRISRALGGHCCVTASRKSFKPAPGCGVGCRGLPVEHCSVVSGVQFTRHAFSRAPDLQWT